MANRESFTYSENSVNLMTTESEQPEDFLNLYRRAFAEYGPRVL